MSPKLISCIGSLCLSGVALAGVRYGERNLLDFAKRDASGNLVIDWKAGADGDPVWGTGYATTVFDGNLTTAFDPRTAMWDTWVGYDLTEACHLTRVRFYGREKGDGPDRLRCCSVAGIRTEGETYSDAPDIFVTKTVVPSGWRSAPRWFEVAPKAESRVPKYVGFRFGERSSWKYTEGGKTFCGNVTELVFYGMTDESFKAFDGDRTTVLNLSAGDTVERNFGASVPVAEVRVVYAAATAAGDWIEVSENDDFSSAKKVLTIASDQAVDTVVVHALTDVRGKCVRYVSKNGGQVAEIEFVPATQVAGVAFTRKVDSSYDPYFSVNLIPAAGIGGTTKILRGPGRGGPWTAVTSLTDGASLWDDTADPQAVGGVYYYKFVSAYPFDGAEVEMPEPLPVRAPIRDEHLERTKADLKHLAPGCSIIANCGQKCWVPETSTDWAVISNSMALAFDNVLGRSSQPDIQKKEPHTALGVDFGEPCRFTNFRLYFANNVNANSNRIVNVKFAGSNAENWVTDGNFTVLTEDFIMKGVPLWYEAECNTDTAFRYCFVYNSRDQEWGCNASELQYYGYRSSAVDNVSVGVENFRVVSVDGSANVRLTWDAALYGGTYTVQRKVGDGAWTSVSEVLSTTSFTDELTFDGLVYDYRVVTEKGSGGPAYSETVSVQMYARGDGTGLYAQIASPFVSTTVNPQSATTVLPATTVGGVDLSAYADGVFAKWSGKLIVPIAGTYRIDAGEDELTCVWVDGKPVHYIAGPSGGVTHKNVSLTVGEHDIVVTTYRNGAGTRAALYWSGPVVREEILASQFKPVAPAALPEGWVEWRSFAPNAAAYYPSDYAITPDGVIRGAFGGPDLWGTANGYSYLYQPVTGDFTFRVRVDRIPGLPTSRKAGVMLRSSLDADAVFEGYLLELNTSAQVGIGGKARTTKGGGISDVWTIGAKGSYEVRCPSGGAYFRVRREGSNVKVYCRDTRGDPWMLVFDRTLGAAFGETIYVGLLLSGAGDIWNPDYCATFRDAEFGDKGLVLIFR